MKVGLIIFLLLNVFILGSAVSKKGLSPVILVPGDGGSQIMAKWTSQNYEGLFDICQNNQTDWYQIWVNFKIMSVDVQCLVDKMTLVYDKRTKTTKNAPGVQIEPKDFGNSTSVEYLAAAAHDVIPTGYYNVVVSDLLALGYDRISLIRGAPYDFRKAPNELDGYFVDIKKLIEETYKENKEKVTLIAHSLGGPVIHYFLIHQEQSWKDKYIQSVIGLSAAWSGSVKAIKVFATGYNLGLSFISSYQMRTIQRSNPSLAFLLPSTNIWKYDELLVETPTKNYTLANLREYFHDLKYPTGYDMYLDTRYLLQDAPAPGVEVHCLYGDDVKTVERLTYKTAANFPDTPLVVYGDGDGTVNRRSLETCLKWNQKAKVYPMKFKGAEHMAMLKDKRVLHYITEYLKKVQQENLNRIQKSSKVQSKYPFVEYNSLNS